MTRELSKAWWLLALCGILDAMHAAMNLLMRNPDGSAILREFGASNAIWDMGILAVAAGACAIAVGIWNSGREASWLLSLHGLALGGFGLIAVSPIVRGPVSFRPVSVLFALMAASIGAFALTTARRLRPGGSTQWLLITAAAASMGFGFSFLAVGFKLVRLGPPSAFFVWMSSYFGFCAIFMLWLALRVRTYGLFRFGQTKPLSPLPQPKNCLDQFVHQRL
jgi:uncharacterized membrane protein HdeD (DUF308 family)